MQPFRSWSFHLIYLSILYLFSACTPPDNLSSSREYVDLVFPTLDTENSRWFFFSSACRPFGMVNLSPDTQIDGAWGSGYRHQVDTIKGFSHIHAWQLSGLSMMPVSSFDATIYEDYFSHFSHEEESIYPGYHRVMLDRYGIEVKLTSTKRVGFHQYTFGSGPNGLMINVGGVLGPSEIINGKVEQVNATELVGELTNAPTFRRPNPTKVFFSIQFDQEIAGLNGPEQEGKYLVTWRKGAKQVQMKVGISYTSIANARINIQEECPGWDFKAVVQDSRKEWNDYLGRIAVEGGTDSQQRRFYTDLWHALQGRRTISDVNGYYPDYTGAQLKVRQVPLDASQKPLFDHYNSDSFWGAQWTINTLWHLVYPEVSQDFVQSLLQYHRDGGMVPRGPSGGNYTYVMTGASSTPFIVSAYQKGIDGFDIDEAYAALRKNHMPGGIMAKAGYEHQTSLGGGLEHYLSNGYVPWPIPEGKFGSHQDGASLTLEYAYQDWALAQLAEVLAKEEDYNYFMERSNNYRNVFDLEEGWMRPKDIDGNWYAAFDPYEYEHGFNESNGAQSTWFVPHDLRGLADLMGGTDKAVEKLNEQFEQAKLLGFTSGTAHAKERHPEYSRIPINYGNQPSIQTAFVFNHLGRPDLTQYWVRQVVAAVYEGLQTDRGYNGDEDQGLMGALAVLMKIGLFQMNGGTERDPLYEVFTPSFDKITIQLSPDFYSGDQLVIKTAGNTVENVYLDEMKLNGQALEEVFIPHSELVKGGELELLLKP